MVRGAGTGKGAAAGSLLSLGSLLSRLLSLHASLPGDSSRQPMGGGLGSVGEAAFVSRLVSMLCVFRCPPPPPRTPATEQLSSAAGARGPKLSAPEPLCLCCAVPRLRPWLGLEAGDPGPASPPPGGGGAFFTLFFRSLQ